MRAKAAIIIGVRAEPPNVLCDTGRVSCVSARPGYTKLGQSHRQIVSKCWRPALYGEKMTKSSAYVKWLMTASNQAACGTSAKQLQSIINLYVKYITWWKESIKHTNIVEICWLFKTKISFRPKIYLFVPFLGLKPNWLTDVSTNCSNLFNEILARILDKILARATGNR